MYSKIKLFGHPIHPMLIAYPIAFYTSTLVGFCIYAATGTMFWLKLTIAVNLAGIVMAALAALPGFLDWLLGIPSGTGAKTDGMKHGLLNVASLGFLVASFVSYASHWNGAIGRRRTRDRACGARRALHARGRLVRVDAGPGLARRRGSAGNAGPGR